MANRAGEAVQNLSGEFAYSSFYPQPLPPKPNIEIDEEMRELLIDAHKKLALLDGLSDRIPNKDLFISMCVRKEALVSSQIEGTQCTLDDVLNPEIDENANADVSDVVRTSAQTLTPEQKEQARDNIGAITGHFVSYSEQQTIPAMDQARARDNISAQPAGSYVAYSANQGLTAQEKEDARANIKAAEDTIVQDLSALGTVQPQDNHIYKFFATGGQASIAISNPPATGAYAIMFESGSTATVMTGHTGILGLESFVPDANTIYEISVYDNRAVVGSWEVTPVV